MKVTDIFARSAFFDTFLVPDMDILEVGTDAGAHIENIFNHCSPRTVTMIDIWENKFPKGICQGRLHKWFNKILMVEGESHAIAVDHVAFVIHGIRVENFHAVYIDIPHDYETVKQSLNDWWPTLYKSGILGYRNYAESNEGLKRAVDEFIKEKNITHTEYSSFHNEIVLFK